MRLPIVTLFILTTSLLHVTATTLPLGVGGHETLKASQGALEDLLEVTFGPQCSLIAITDQATSPTTLKQVTEDRGSGVGMVEVTVKNLTTFNLTQALANALPHAHKLRLSAWCTMVVVVSDDFAFLDAFATAADNARLLVWLTRLLVVTVLPEQTLYTLLASQWVFAKMNALFITSIKEEGRWQIVSHLPYTPDGPQVVQLASWTPKGGFLHTASLPLFPDKYTNFHGAQVNMSLFYFPPYWIPLGGNSSSTSSYTGRTYMMLDTIATKLNFSAYLLTTDSVVEEQDMIETRVALMSPMKLAMMPHKLKRFDYSIFVEPATLTFAMAKPQLRPQWQSLYQPLEGKVWLSIVVFLVIVPAILVIIIRVAPDVQKKTGRSETLSTGIRKSSKRQHPKSSEVVQEVLGTFLGQNLSMRLLDRSSTRVVVGVWLVFAFIMATVYRSSLFAFLTVPKYPPRPENLNQLVQTDASVLMPPDVHVSFYPYFQASNSSTARKLVQHILKVPSHQEGLREALKGKTAYVYESMFLRLMVGREYTDAAGWSPLYVAKEYIIPGYSAWLLQRDAPFKHAIDRFILAYHGAGLLRHWNEAVLNEARLRERLQRRREGKEETQVREKSGVLRPFTLTHLHGPLFLLALGLILSLLTFALEWLTFHCLASKLSESQA